MENLRRKLNFQPRISKTQRAGTIMSVSRIESNLRKGRYAKRIRVTSAVYLAAVLEYLSAEILELAGSEAIKNKKKRISPRHIMMSINDDAELAELLKDVIIPEAGVPSRIHPALLPKNSINTIADLLAKLNV